jgi:hypothetical protein
VLDDEAAPEYRPEMIDVLAAQNAIWWPRRFFTRASGTSPPLGGDRRLSAMGTQPRLRRRERAPQNPFCISTITGTGLRSVISRPVAFSEDSTTWPRCCWRAGRSGALPGRVSGAGMARGVRGFGYLTEFVLRPDHGRSQVVGTNGEPENQALRCGNGSRFSSDSRRQTALKAFPYDSRTGTGQKRAVAAGAADHGQGGR